MPKHKTMLATLALNCSLAVSALAQDLPNLIFILTDDQGIDAIEWPPGTFNPNIHTPTLNRMAQQGVSFTNCRVNPNSSPTRACLMTGRSALDTGVVGVIGRYVPLAEMGNPCESTPLSGTVAQVTNRLALQTQERTIAEVLQDMGYYTILIDKWHLGYNEGGEERGQRPHNEQGLDQGFDVFEDWQEYICNGYLGPAYFFADNHMVRMAEKARDAVNNRPDPQSTPYALFYHTITPHIRHSDGVSGWWDILDKDRLLYHTRNFGDTPPQRFLKNLEAFDSVLLKDLLTTGDDRLGVLDGDGYYRAQSNTIVFFLGDNGTDASLNPKGKNTLFEGGVRVPLFVMGAGVPSDIQNPLMVNRQVSHVDFYDTICDIVQAPPEVRDNPHGYFPRRGRSFAYNIGYSETEETRDYTCSSLGNADTGTQVWRVSLVSDRYKLVCSSGGAGLDTMEFDEFYDLFLDPNETRNLINEGMTYGEISEYYDLRDLISDHWPTAVSVAPEPEIMPTYRAEHQSGGYVLVFIVVNYELKDPAYDEFYNYLQDPHRDHDLLEEGMTPAEEQLYLAMREEIEGMWEIGQRIVANPDLRVVDIDAVATLTIALPIPPMPPTALTIGHQDAGGQNHREYRSYIKFLVDDQHIPFPPGFSYDDVIGAHLIVHFKHDSRPFNPNSPDSNYINRDSDTGMITVRKMLGPWDSDPWDDFDEDLVLGEFDPPPHIIAIPFSGQGENKVRVVPMPEGTPVSFGHSVDLLDTIDAWRANPTNNYGVVLIADELPLFLSGTDLRDQHVHFLPADALLRLTLRREPQ